MSPTLLIAMLTVGGGLGALVLGIERSVATVRDDTDAIEAITADAPDVHFSPLQRPFMERLLGPAFGAFNKIGRALTPTWWLERIRHNTELAGLTQWGVEGVLALKALVALVCAVGFAFGSSMLGMTSAVMWAIIGALFGFFAPDIWIARRVGFRQREITNTLPE